MALVRRMLGVTITSTSGSFTEGGNTAKLPNGLRMSAVLQNAGGLSDGTLDLTIYGMTRSLMNQLSTYGLKYNLVTKNQITLTAGTTGAMPTAFIGNIVAAYADYNASPDVAFHLTAHTLGAFGAAPAEASSFKGSADVATIMAGFATKMGLRFENAGVATKLSNPYFSGSLRDQARACVKAAGISWNSGELGLLAIWPKWGSRGGHVPLIAPPPKGGMIGYPTFNELGVHVMMLYNNPPFGLGQKVQVESSLKPACGVFSAYNLQHELESETPNGKWFTQFDGYMPKVPAPPK